MDSEDPNYIAPSRPKWSVDFPGYPGAYLRFSTADLIRLCEQLNAAGLIGLMHRVDILDVKAIMACATTGLKVDEGMTKPALESVSLETIKETVLEALSQRTFAKSTADVAADVARRNAEFITPYLDPNPLERAKSDEPREKASLDE